MPWINLPSLNRPQRFVLALVCTWFVFVIIGCNLLMANRQAASEKPLPFGIVWQKNSMSDQDFGYNMLYLEGIRDRVVSHPYRLEDQEKMMRQLLPDASYGMSHAYSPVAFILAQPLFALPGQGSFLAFTLLSAVGIGLLYYLVLLPRAPDSLQLLGLSLCALSLWVACTFLVGQTAIVTTTLVGFIWWLLRPSPGTRSLFTDLLIALLFWAVCVKPSVAIISFFLLVGARAWRPLAVGMGLLLLTWLGTASHYGGMATGLQDYLYLLNHYVNADFTPFMRRAAETPESTWWEHLWFTLDRNVILLAGATLILARWKEWITPSEQFEGTVWTFLLFSPYMMPTENWILVLLVVETSFFLSPWRLLNLGKLVILAAVLDLRAEVNFPIQPEYQLKWALFLWILIEWTLSRLSKAKGTPAA